MLLYAWYKLYCGMKIILPILFLLLSSIANAGKIAVVNYARIESDSAVTKSITQQIQKKQEELQKEVQVIQTDVQAKVEDLEKSASVLTAKALEQKKANLQKELLQTDEQLKAKAQKLENIKNKTLLDLNEQIKDIVAEIAKKQGYDFVLSEGSAVYFDDKYDITDDVLKALNKKIPSVKIDWSK